MEGYPGYEPEHDDPKGVQADEGDAPAAALVPPAAAGEAVEVSAAGVAEDVDALLTHTATSTVRAAQAQGPSGRLAAAAKPKGLEYLFGVIRRPSSEPQRGGSAASGSPLQGTVFSEWWAHNTAEEKAAFGKH